VTGTPDILDLPGTTRGGQINPKIMTRKTGKDLDHNSVAHYRDVSRANATGDILGAKEGIMGQGLPQVKPGDGLRKVPDRNGLDATPIKHTRHLNDCTDRQITNIARVRHVDGRPVTGSSRKP
jgi:hypothetical protein